MSERIYRAVNRAVPKSDARSIMGGAPVYTEDFVPRNALKVYLLRSPHAFARILSIDKSRAEAVEGVACVLTWQDVPRRRHSIAGSATPGNNPLDRYVLEDVVRFVGDPVAIVAAETAEAARKALKLVKVKYEVLKPVLDFESAEDHPSVVHPEEDYVFPMDIGGDVKRNILTRQDEGGGDFDAVYAACPVRLDETWYSCQNEQAMMETFRTYCYWDHSRRLTLITSTQITFHARRIIADALGLPQSRIRVIKPRIGGGFGAKQTLGSEIYAAVVTYITGRPAYCRFSRRETFSCTNTRHAFRIRVRLGAQTDGTVRALWVDSLENAGAYGEHSVNVIGLSAHKTLPLYAKAAWRYTGKAVYTNTVPGGAYRGFGATQGCFAVESTVNMMAERLGLDPAEVRLKNMPAVGEKMSAYYDEPLTSCVLDRCIKTGREMIGWAEKYSPVPKAYKTAPHRYRGLGIAVTMQGSGISCIDKGSVRLRLEDGDAYTLSIGASDMGTGCDTILAQMAAEVLQCDPEKISVIGVDTGYSPYDSGSYASSTTYVTGNAVVKASNELLKKMRLAAARSLGVEEGLLVFDGETFCGGEKRLTVFDLGRASVIGTAQCLEAEAEFCGVTSPPPFVAAFAEVEVDDETGEVELKDLVGVVDCGTVINTALARVQAEGGFIQGAGMALIEAEGILPNGRLSGDSFLQYKIPSRLDFPKPRIFFEESHEPSGPFGAKSIGEVVINAVAPAICSAVENAIGARIHDLPVTAEKVYNALRRDG